MATVNPSVLKSTYKFSRIDNSPLCSFITYKNFLHKIFFFYSYHSVYLSQKCLNDCLMFMISFLMWTELCFGVTNDRSLSVCVYADYSSLWILRRVLKEVSTFS